jgi:hypothetical protein
MKLARIIHDGSSRNQLWSRGTGSAVCGSAYPQQYGEGLIGEPAGRRPVVAADRRLQQKRSWIIGLEEGECEQAAANRD